MPSEQVGAHEATLQHGEAEGEGKVTPLEVMLEGMLRRDESTVLHVYDDATGEAIKPGSHVVGHPTIGTGRALDTNGISPGEADYFLMSDMCQVQGEAQKAFSWYNTLKDERKAVILSMLFQLGLEGVKGFHEFLLAVEHQNWSRAAAEMKDSLWAKQTTARAERLAEQIETGLYQK